MVALVLVGIRGTEPDHGLVEGGAAAEVGADGDGVAGTGMRPSEHPAAHLPVDLERPRVHGVDIGRGLPVPQLAHVVVVLPAVDALLDALPAEEDVAGGLHQPLPLDHALTVVRELALGEVGLEDRRLGFLDLQEERVVVVAADQEGYPRARADAADPDDLAGQLDEAVLREQVAPVAGQGCLVGTHDTRDGLEEVLVVGLGEQLPGRDQQRRVADEPELTVDDPGELRLGLEPVLGLGLVDRPLEPLHHRAAHVLPHQGEELRLIQVLVPDVEPAHARRSP